MIKKLINYIWIMLEILKSFILAVILVVAIFVSIVSILHNVFKIREIYAEDTTGYKQLIWVNENRMNAQVIGEGEKTIVILSDYATPSPIVQYKTYVDRLASSYRVVILEPFGYGFSLSTKDERSSEKIAEEIKLALEYLKIEGSYAILANGMSSLYAYTYANLYPDVVERLIIVDGIYPATIKDDYLKKLVKEYETNAVITSYAELTGFARIMSYIKPEEFGIDKLAEYGFSDSDISLYRKMIANRFYTSTMRREIQKLEENMGNLKDYKLPDYLPVTQVLSTEYVGEYDQYKKSKLTDKNLQAYANEIVTNAQIQNIVIIKGNKNLNIYNPDGVVQAIISE